ncbi:NOL1/NOP2/sun family putative RNA methylase [archaeon]|jgi:tRNA (cytosine49-C5)-methyltransferase|nr:NOL1/NOP2/sun family putative RNA methylase [archaeon]MBT4396717.1 NOL1/NOP2/sun family putative RNA methylase [archaeon]MBT4441327.1 NOL1/NOP2/sun family putative RNA methylase [archaeon]
MADWKKSFIERYAKLTDVDAFTEASLKPMRKSIRVNTLKTSIKHIKDTFKLTQVPWCKEGFFINRKAVGNTLEHYLGYIYIQGAASMIPPTILKPKANEVVLDMCASPGSKTSQMAAMMKNTGMIVANDNKIVRLKPLTLNLQRCGVTNTVLTIMEGRWFKHKFDKILVDAPCSGIGTIRKSYKTIEMWNPNTIRKFAGVQRQLIKTAFDNLEEDGTMVYSTCTLEPDEDEGVIDYLLKEYDNAKLEKFSIDMKRGETTTDFEGKVFDSDVKKCLKVWPQDNDTEGFFVARIKKTF